jgi:hypothetical protein
MPGGYVELYIDQGTTFADTIHLTSDVTGANMNLSGYSARSQMRRSHYSQNASANLTCTIATPNSGQIAITLTSANTANLSPGKYVFDLEIESSTGVVTRPIEGVIVVTPGVTR